MTRLETEAEAELADVQAQIARLQIRELFLQTRLRHAKVADGDDAARPGWPITRTTQTSACRISNSAPSLIAV